MPTFLEFLIAISSNLHAVMGVFSVLLGIATIVMIIASVVASAEAARYSDSERSKAQAALLGKITKRVTTIFVLTLVLAMIPDVDEIWKVRISLIKFQLASPQNLEKGTEAIERIGKVLECKYIGTNCDDKKK